MKKILFTLLCFSLFACSKESSEVDTEEQNKKLIEETLDRLDGKWKVSRVAKDEDFTDLIDLEYTPKEKECNYITFIRKDLDFICNFYIPEVNREYNEKGYYQIEIIDNVMWLTSNISIKYKSSKTGIALGSIRICFPSETTFVINFKSDQKYLEYTKVL